MKLAEALIQRAEIKTQIENLRERLKSNAVVQEGEKPIENPTELMEMVDRKIVELENLIKILFMLFTLIGIIDFIKLSVKILR